MKEKISVIGAAIIDVVAGAVDASVLERGSTPMDSISMSYGGDALNEAVIMSRLGLNVELITRLGADEAGKNITTFLAANGVSCKAVYDETIATGINIVLVDGDGQRRFLTNPKGSLRQLQENDIDVNISEMGDIVCFASMFVSPKLDIPAMERIFAKIKNSGRRLVVDMTTAKQGETIEDIRCLLQYIDYIIPNETEIARLTGIDDTQKNARLLTDAGVNCAIVKCGGDGCLVRTGSDSFTIPAYPVAKVKDTTGAGDSFVAGFVYGLSKGMDIKECCRFGCAVSSCVIEEYGTQDGLKSLDKPMKRYQEMTF